MTKAEAIRKVTDNNLALSNQQIRDEVRERFGLDVQSNHIIGVIGPFHKRVHLAGYSDLLLEKARDYALAVGDDHLAKTLLQRVLN